MLVFPLIFRDLSSARENIEASRAKKKEQNFACVMCNIVHLFCSGPNEDVLEEFPEAPNRDVPNDSGSQYFSADPNKASTQI